MASDREALVAETKSLICEGDRCSEKAAEFYRQAGHRLRVLKDTRPRNLPWESFVTSVIGISRERADELIRVAEGRTTVEAIQAGNRHRQARHRQKQALRHTGIDWPFLFADKVTLATTMIENAPLPELPTESHIELLLDLIAACEERVAELQAVIAPHEAARILLAAKPQPEAAALSV
jgi:hypothetical protein